MYWPSETDYGMYIITHHLFTCECAFFCFPCVCLCLLCTYTYVCACGKTYIYINIHMYVFTYIHRSINLYFRRMSSDVQDSDDPYSDVDDDDEIVKATPSPPE